MAAVLIAALGRWRWLLLFVAAALLLTAVVPARMSLGPSLPLLQPASAWALSEAMSERVEKQEIVWTAAGNGPAIASRLLEVDPQAEFLRLRACMGSDAPGAAAQVMLASIREGILDFNRQYQLRGLAELAAGECAEDAIPRRRGDGPAVLQLQLTATASALSLQALSITPLRENPRWRILRMLMLSIGILLLALQFRRYRSERPQLLAQAGLLTVLGIIFGCCVSVSLKADLYALLTGGRSLAAPSELAELLASPFPLGGFSFFTAMHALLFGSATLALGLVRRRALADMLLLAPVTEVLQIFVPGRGPGFSDVLVDWSGVLVGAALVVLLGRSQRVRAFLEHQRIDKDAARL